MKALNHFPFFAAVLMTTLVCFKASAGVPVVTSKQVLTEVFQERKQEKGGKKPVKEVPQSRKQDKPREVKPGSKGGRN